MRFGAAFWIQRTDWPDLRDACVAAERAGWDTIQCQASATISGLRLARRIASPPIMAMAAVSIAVRGQSALTATPRARCSAAMPSTHIDMPYFDMV